MLSGIGLVCRNVELAALVRPCVCALLGQVVQFFGAMNSFGLNGFHQYAVNYLAGNFAGQAGLPLYASHFGSTQGLALQVPLAPLQQQFIQNFVFGNQDRYHQAAARVGPRREQSQSSPDLCSSIKQEILKQLNVNCDSPDSSREPSPNDQETPQCDSRKEIMHARGVKRQLDLRPSPQRKHPRPEEGDAEEDRSGHPTPSPSPLGQPMPYDKNSNEVWRFYKQKQQLDETYNRKMRLREALFAVMKGVFPFCGLYVVGSSMNGFGSESSDMDMCLMLSHLEIDQRREAPELLRVVLRALRRCSFLKEVQLIKAKVPILKFRDRLSGIECDLNINNSVGIKNTHLLNAYARLDWRVCPLVLFIKHWAKHHDINDASKGTISSYSLVLMVVHYFQYGCNPPVLPSLQQKFPYKFDAHVDIRTLTLNEKLPPFASPNNQSLGELFVGFIQYYANVFRFEEDAISVRLGGKVPRHVVVRQSAHRNPPSQWKCICIEEPFDLSNTARSVYDYHQFERIRRVFRVSFAKLRNTGDVRNVLSDPF